jgi:hypothetical protein
MASTERDPDTITALIFRLVDVPHRALAAGALAVILLAAASLAAAPVENLTRNGLLCGSGVSMAGLSWLYRRRPPHRSRRATTPPDRGHRPARTATGRPARCRAAGKDQASPVAGARKVPRGCADGRGRHP